MKNNRKPEYHKTEPLRIVSRPNGFWALQRNTKPEDFRSNTVDKWEDQIGCSKLPYEVAKQRLGGQIALNS